MGGIHDEESASGADMRMPSSRPGWLVPITAGVVILALTGCGVSYGMATHHEQATYEQAVKAADSSFARLTKAVKEARETLTGVRPDQVKDAESLGILKKSVERAQSAKAPSANVNQWFLWELKEAETTLASAQERASGMAKRLDEAVRSVKASQAAKRLDDARNALNAKLDAARKILTDSDGRVQDGNTRDALQKLIDEAEGLSSTKPKDYSDRATALDRAVEAVNASIQARQEAEAKAAREAAAAQANRGYPEGGHPSGASGYHRDGGGAREGQGNTAYTTDNPAGRHQFWKDLNSGKTCSFSFEAGDPDFNDNPMTCQ